MAKPFAPDVTTCATHRVLHRLSCRARIGDDVQRPGGLHFGQVPQSVEQLEQVSHASQAPFPHTGGGEQLPQSAGQLEQVSPGWQTPLPQTMGGAQAPQSPRDEGAAAHAGAHCEEPASLSAA